MPTYDDYYKQVAHLFNDIRLDQKEEIDSTINVIEKHTKSKIGTLLDIGTGTGRYTSPLVSKGYKVIGLDKSFDQLRYFSVNFKNAICASSATLPFNNAVFSCCFCILMLHQLSDNERNQTLGEVYRVLKNNGTLIIKTCTHDDLRKRPFNDIFPTGLKINLSRYPDIEILKQELENFGYRLAEKINTFSVQSLETSKLLYSIKNKHNSTMALIPTDEFEKGYRFLENSMQSNEFTQIPHHHTILVARK